MPTANAEKLLAALKELYGRLSFAYRRGDFEQAVHLTTRSGLRPNPLSIFTGDFSLTSFCNAAVKLFEKAQELDGYDREADDLPAELREQVAESVLLAQTLSYEIMDYFLMTAPDVSQHFLKMAGEVSRDVEGYYRKNYEFVVSPRAKVVIVKQLVLGALSGVNVHYRSYAAAGYNSGMTQVAKLIEFLEDRFPKFCGRDRTSFGLLGLAYFLKGRLLLNSSLYDEADDCFRRSADNYVRKLTNREAAPMPHGPPPGDIDEPVKVPVGELLAFRRAALVLAFGRGYSALINSRIKESMSFLILARGALHFNCPSVYSSYAELLYWAAKRAGHSNDLATLEAARRRLEDCRRVFEEQVPDSHYPHRAGIEQGLVLHYLAQQRPAKRSEYYREAVSKLKVAVEFAKGDDVSRRQNVQLYSEACYILSHLLRYQYADLTPPDAEQSVLSLREALMYAKVAEEVARPFPRHRCEALLALCGVYAEVDKRKIRLSEVDAHARPGDTALACARNNAHKALEVNKGVNHRISGICFLRLVDNYLKSASTYSRAVTYWDEWLKVSGSIEHAFVKDWAVRIEAELNKVKGRNLVIDLAGGESISAMRDSLNAAFAKRKIVEWVQNSYGLYKRTNKKHPDDIVKRRKPGAPGRDIYLKTALENYLLEELQVRNKSEVSELIKKHKLLKLATELMSSYLG
jgi:tetratricopeptide (TPR) repeat protein